MAHYPAYGAQREGRVPGQPASVVMGGLDTISAGSGVGQPQAATPTDPNRPRGPPEKLLGLSVWVQRLRGVAAAGGGGSASPALEPRALEARADAMGGATPGPRLPLGLERLPPGVPLFGALRGLAATRVEEGNLQPGGAKQAVQEAPEEQSERPGDAGSAHEGGETPRPEDANESEEKPKAAPPIRDAPALPDIPNQARGSGPSASGPVFLGGVKHSTDTASRSVEGPSEHAGGGGAGPTPPRNPPANPASASQRSHPRSRSTNAYGQGLARRYGLADAIREQQEAAAVRKWMSKGSGSGSHAFKASNGTGASGGGGTGSRPSVEVGAPSPSVAHPPHFGEGSQHTGNEVLRSGGSLGGEGGKASSQDRGALQNRNGRGGGEMGVRGSERDLKGDGRVQEDRANHLRANAAARGFGSFGSLREGSPFDGVGRSSQNGLGGQFGEGQSGDGSGGSKNQSGGKRGMGAWVKRLGIGQAARGSGNQTQSEDQRGGNGEPGGDGARGKGEGAAGNAKLGGGQAVEMGLGNGDEGAVQRSGARALEREGNKGGLKGAGVFAEQGGAEPRGEGQKRVVVERRQTGGLSFLPSFKAPPPLIIPGSETAAEFLNEGLEVQDVADAGELDVFRTLSGHCLDTIWTICGHALDSVWTLSGHYLGTICTLS
jgi:hypothetical protein